MKKMLAQADAARLDKWTVDGLQHLALMYTLQEDHKNRDRVFARLLEQLDHTNVENRSAFQIAGAYAAIADAEKSAENLNQAYERGFRRLYLIKAYWLFDPVRESPEFKAVIEIIEKDNARMLAEIRAGR